MSTGVYKRLALYYAREKCISFNNLIIYYLDPLDLGSRNFWLWGITLHARTSVATEKYSVAARHVVALLKTNKKLTSKCAKLKYEILMTTNIISGF